MIDTDLARLADILDSLSDYYQREPLKPMGVKIYFKALESYSIDQIADAVTLHLQDSKSGTYYPKAADLIKHISGGEIKADDIVAAAKLANTPLGILARIQIGSWDLDNLNSFDLRQRAAECMLLLPEWKTRAQAGEYTDHEISIMIKHDVNPVAPFSIGFAGPQNALALESRVKGVMCTDRHKSLIEPLYVESEGESKVMAPEVRDVYLNSLRLAAPAEEESNDEH